MATALVLLPVLGQPRHAKRVQTIMSAGFDVTVAAFQRDYHTGRLPPCPVVELGWVEASNYRSRPLAYGAALKTVRRLAANCEIVYAFGVDMAALAAAAVIGTPARLVIEIGDVRELQVSTSLAGRVVRLAERLVLTRTSLLVATAERFVSAYYRARLQAPTPSLVLENKLEQSFFAQVPLLRRHRSPDGVAFTGRPVVVGYFGLIRCDWTWQVLERLATHPSRRFRVIAAGKLVSRDASESVASGRSAIDFRGEYKSPDDLEALYASVDMVWASYAPIGPNDWNLRWARTNRFYESCFFGKPLVAREGSCDGDETERLQVGLTLRETTVDDAAARLLNISEGDLRLWANNAQRLDPTIYVHGEDVEEFKRALLSLASSLEAYR